MRQVLVGDRRNQGLLEPRRLLHGLLEVDTRFGQAANLGEQRAEVDVDACPCLTELVGSVAEHLQCRLVGRQCGIELALLVQDDAAVEVGVTELGTAHRRLGDVEDRQRVPASSP